MTHQMAGAIKASGTTRPARRLRFNRWRDPRLILGMLLVTSSVLFGAYVFSGQDDTVKYWTVIENVHSGEPIDAGSLRAISVRLSAAAQDRYLEVSEQMPGRLGDLVWTRDLERGELLTTSAMTTATLAGAEFPLNVGAGHFPADLRRGDLVDVWVSAKENDGTTTAAKRVLSSVAVLSAGESDDTLGESLSSTILVGLDKEDLKSEVVGAMAGGDITLVRLP